MPDSAFLIYEGDCLVLLGRGLVGWLGCLGEVKSSLGFGMEIGVICLCNNEGHASWIMIGHSVGE